MSARASRLITAAAATGLLVSALAPTAVAAPPPLPEPPPIIPGSPFGNNFYYNLMEIPGPATTDSRGVRTGTNVDTSQSDTGMPGSKLGNSPPRPNPFTDSNARYGIAAGGIPPQAFSPGVNISAGIESTPLEDPYGRPPQNIAGPEAVAPTTEPGGPGIPAPVLEDPYGRPPPAS
jgi:hypothetical protein